MNLYKIDYQDALNGEYKEQIIHDDPFGRYFDQMGATCYREYGDPKLELGSDHIQNVVDLIYSGRKHGIDQIELTISNDDCLESIKTHYYALASLPEVVTEIDQTSENTVLSVTFEYGINTSKYQSKTNMGEQLTNLSNQELEEIFDEVEKEVREEDKEGKSLSWENTLVNANKLGIRRGVRLPDWIKKKCEIEEDIYDAKKEFSDAIARVAEIFGQGSDE